MSPATVGYPPQDINVSQSGQPSRARTKYQLLEDYKHFSWADQNFDLSKVIGEGAKLSAIVSAIDPKQKTGGKLYHRLRRLLNSLESLNCVSISGNWTYGDMLERPGNMVQPNSTLLTLINRMQNSNHFANSIPEGWKAVVDHYLPDDAVNAKVDPCRLCTRPVAWRDPVAVAERTQPARCRGCSRKKEKDSPCVSCTRKKDNRDLTAVRRSRWCAACPVGTVRTWKPSPCGTCTFWKNKVCTTTKRQCPYRLTVCSRSERKKAAWKLRAIDGRWGRHHWMFVRKKLSDKKEIVQPALTKRIETVQSHFETWHEDCKKRVIILRHKHGHHGRKSMHRTESCRRDMVEHLLKDGNELVLDYQTRFTDEGRMKEEIKKYHDAWREAEKKYDGAVFLTLTSDPASNDSLWDVNRHFAPAWDDYVSLLTKRFRIRRREDLIAAKLADIKTYEPARWERINRMRKENRALVDGLIKAITLKCKKCSRTRELDRDYGAVKKARWEYQQNIFRAERRYRPYLGLNDDESRDIKVRLDLRTNPDGTVVRETYRPVYLTVYEFMENGLLHAHIIIFGTTWIDNIDQIKDDWDRLGQGAMARAYGIVKTGGVWTWMSAAPSDSRNRQPVDYLIKYLIKGLYTQEGHGLYWALNKRFFTRSQSLDSGWIDFKDGESVWQLLASLHEDNIPMAIKKQQRGAPLLKAWYERWGSDPGGGVLA